MTPPSENGRPSVLAGLIAISPAVAALIVLTAVDPSTSDLFPPCFFRAATGWLCPGCGSARAIHAAMHGELGTALLANPLAVALMPVGPFHVYRFFWGGRPAIPATLNAGVIRSLGPTLVAFAVARNILNW
jgi:hypothetical protein